MNNITDTVKQLIIINIIFFVGSILVGEATSLDILSLQFIDNPKFQYWQLLTHMFMHGGLMHILFNMYGLFAFGTALEQMWGGKKFLFFYISCGLGAGLIQMGVNYYHYQQGVDFLISNGFTTDDLAMLLNEGKFNLIKQDAVNQQVVTNMMEAYHNRMVGASGAIYGVLVAFAFMFPHAELMMLFIPFPIKAKFFVPILIGVDLFSGVTGYSLFGGGIAHFAHVGGALFGFIIMWFWKKDQFSNNRWDR